jgi:hypothetical protein
MSCFSVVAVDTSTKIARLSSTGGHDDWLPLVGP